MFGLTSHTRHIGRDTTGNLLSKGALGTGPELQESLIVIDKSGAETAHWASSG